MGPRSTGPLSRGVAARVALARALVRRPKILVVDEPAALLAVAAEDVTRVLRGLAGATEGGSCAVVLVAAKGDAAEAVAGLVDSIVDLDCASRTPNRDLESTCRRVRVEQQLAGLQRLRGFGDSSVRRMRVHLLTGLCCNFTGLLKNFGLSTFSPLFFNFSRSALHPSAPPPRRATRRARASAPWRRRRSPRPPRCPRGRGPALSPLRAERRRRRR